MESRPQFTLALLTLLALGPFITKPFNMDDPLFLWAAKQIHFHPGNPYGFLVYWYKTPMPMWDVTKNPPLACYYLALAAEIFGWSESALHAAFLIPAILAVLGTYRLARRFCNRPLFAAITALFTPVFLVSGASVMCDVMMLAFWIWAVVLWVEGMENGNSSRLAGSMLLVTLAMYTKYFGVCLIPLLVLYSAARTRRAGRWLVYFLVPIAGLVLYQSSTFHLYGKGLFTDAGDYATHRHSFEVFAVLSNTLITLTFTGGCLAVVAFMAPWLWKRRTLAVYIVGILILTAPLFVGPFWSKYVVFDQMSHKWVGLEVIFWSVGGVSVLGLAVAEAWRRRNAEAWLLSAWVWGTFLFAGFVNWTVNGRSILPMAPAVAILLARRLSERSGDKNVSLGIPVALCSVLAAVLGLLITRADCSFAEANRQGAEQICAKYGHGPGKLWYVGHWGWQYYMEQFGVEGLMEGQSPPNDGDFLAMPLNNNNLNIKTPAVNWLETWPMHERSLFSTLNGNMGAGFYSSLMGPLPFAFGYQPMETIRVFAINSKPSPAK